MNQEAVNLFKQCRIAMETGILPDEGDFLSQDHCFVEVFFDFISHWKYRQYQTWWDDVKIFTKTVLESIFGKKKGR